MYLISLGLSLIHFLFVFFFHDLNGFLIGLTVMIIISLYNENSSTIESKSNDINGITIKTQDTSSKILSSMRKISEFTTKTSTSVEQVLSGAQEQNTRIDDIVLSFESLENLIIELKKLVYSK